MQADAGFVNHVQAGRPAGRLLTQAGPGRPLSEWRPGLAGPAGR